MSIYLDKKMILHREEKEIRKKDIPFFTLKKQEK